MRRAATTSRGVGGGAHELLEPSELDSKGAVGVGEWDGDPPVGQCRRAERGGSGDREVDAVREIRAPVEVWVEQREAEIFSCTTTNARSFKDSRVLACIVLLVGKWTCGCTKEADHEVAVGGPAGGAADGDAVGKTRGVTQHSGVAFPEEVPRVRDGVPEVVDGRDAAHRCLRRRDLRRRRRCDAGAREEQHHE